MFRAAEENRTERVRQRREVSLGQMDDRVHKMVGKEIKSMIVTHLSM